MCFLFVKIKTPMQDFYLDGNTKKKKFLGPLFGQKNNLQ